MSSGFSNGFLVLTVARLQFVTNGTPTATYTRLANPPLIRQIEFTKLRRVDENDKG
jgi:hypothetical protein